MYVNLVNQCIVYIEQSKCNSRGTGSQYCIMPIFKLLVIKNAPVKKTPFYVDVEKQPSIDVPIKRCSENMQQMYRKTLMLKGDFNKVVK